MCLADMSRTLPVAQFTCLLLLLAVMASLSGCGSADKTSPGEKLKVVATTTIIGDVVKQIAGDRIELNVLLPVGASPHSFESTPRDVATLSKADIIFINGLHLEQFLENIIESAGVRERLVSVSQQIKARQLQKKKDQEAKDQAVSRPDPHVWTSPVNVLSWVEVIKETLAQKDSQNRNYYEERAAVYKTQLDSLDQWIQAMIDSIPGENRKLVTDHLMFGYFCERYGLKQVGAIIPSFSTLAEPSARDFARLEDTIRKTKVKAVFVGKTINPNLAEQITRDTGIGLHKIYTGSLGEPGSGAETYIQYMKYNVNQITAALGGNGTS